MSLFRTILLVALVAGIATGVASAAVHLVTTVPLILKAETFEGGEAAADTHAHAAGEAHDHEAGAPAHDHGDGDEWAPADGFERNAFTVVASILTAFGFGLLLVAATELKGGLSSWREGILWGLAGFAVFTLAPGLGLPPELPAMPAADLMARQLWWIGTAVATAAGLALLVFGRSPLFAALGAGAILLPHLVGAPQPVSHDSPIPESLHHSFVVASVAVSFLFWVLLGGLSGWLRPRLGARAG
ncbi:CbtA family protein [Ancylobacter oerskovii]|uniref:CbtA family protein n=1 Tax=Ancylobacter oerskovii TaxID=459519 RepID=A0ABW4YRE4_9HYPH|nr:CbtA family protein [Ancylobacter oerskovii]MBS7545604.1 CbtA family protein [Ancylobacter oerskovii]